MQKGKFIILGLILILYGALHIATSYQVPCEDDCEKVGTFSNDLRKNRDYVYGVYRCTNVAVSDTLCVYVKDTIGVNWNLLADTACVLATQKGLQQQKLFLIRNGNSIRDTILVRQCP